MGSTIMSTMNGVKCGLALERDLVNVWLHKLSKEKFELAIKWAEQMFSTFCVSLLKFTQQHISSPQVCSTCFLMKMLQYYMMTHGPCSAFSRKSVGIWEKDLQTCALRYIFCKHEYATLLL